MRRRRHLTPSVELTSQDSMQLAKPRTPADMGANRLASNSLLECLVVGKAAAHHIAEQSPQTNPELPAWDESRVSDADEKS